MPAVRRRRTRRVARVRAPRSTSRLLRDAAARRARAMRHEPDEHHRAEDARRCRAVPRRWTRNSTMRMTHGDRARCTACSAGVATSRPSTAREHGDRRRDDARRRRAAPRRRARASMSTQLRGARPRPSARHERQQRQDAALAAVVGAHDERAGTSPSPRRSATRRSATGRRARCRGWSASDAVRRCRSTPSARRAGSCRCRRRRRRARRARARRVGAGWLKCKAHAVSAQGSKR